MVRVTWLFVILILCIAVFYIVYKKYKLCFIQNVIVFFVILCFYLGATSMINLNTLSLNEYTAYKSVVNECGESAVMTKLGRVYVLVDGEWLDTSRVSVVGSITSDTITIRCMGREIYCGTTGVASTIRTLKEFGFIK